MPGETLSYLTATESIEGFNQHSLSPVELMQSIIERSELVEAHINAFTDTYFESALEQARAAEKRYASGSQRPLEFCLLGSCHARLWGITRNPWNLDITPGGSGAGLAYERAFHAPPPALDPRITRGDT